MVPSNHRLPERLWGEGGVFTTTADLSLYIEMLLNGGLFQNQAFLQTESIKDMQTGTIASDRKHAQYGLGWFVTEETCEHFGSAPHFTGKLILCPKQSIGYVLLSNTANTVQHALCDNIRKIILGQSVQPIPPKVEIKTRLRSKMLKKLRSTWGR